MSRYEFYAPGNEKKGKRKRTRDTQKEKRHQTANIHTDQLSDK